jgi:hypothetical protein
VDSRVSPLQGSCSCADSTWASLAWLASAQAITFGAFSPAEIANSIAVSEVTGDNCPRPIEPPASPMRASLPGHRQERRQRRLQPRTVPGQYWFPPPKRACSSDWRDKAHGTCDDWGQSLVAFAVGNNPPTLDEDCPRGQGPLVFHPFGPDLTTRPRLWVSGQWTIRKRGRDVARPILNAG